MFCAKLGVWCECYVGGVVVSAALYNIYSIYDIVIFG